MSVWWGGEGAAGVWAPVRMACLEALQECHVQSPPRQLEVTSLGRVPCSEQGVFSHESLVMWAIRVLSDLKSRQNLETRVWLADLVQCLLLAWPECGGHRIWLAT